MQNLKSCCVERFSVINNPPDKSFSTGGATSQVVQQYTNNPSGPEVTRWLRKRAQKIHFAGGRQSVKSRPSVGNHAGWQMEFGTTCAGKIGGYDTLCRSTRSVTGWELNLSAGNQGGLFVVKLIW